MKIGAKGLTCTCLLFSFDCIDLNQLTGVAAILNFPLPDLDDEEEEEHAPEENDDLDEDGLPKMHSNQNHDILDAVLG